MVPLGGRITMPGTVARAATTLCAFATAKTAEVPSAIREQVVALTILVVADTVTGVWFALHAREVASRRLSTALAAKLVLYTLVLALAGSAAILAHNWWVLSSGVLTLIGTEALSIIENLAKLERFGVAMGPLQPFLQKVGRYLLAVNDLERKIPKDDAPSSDEKGA